MVAGTHVIYICINLLHACYKRCHAMFLPIAKTTTTGRPPPCWNLMSSANAQFVVNAHATAARATANKKRTDHSHVFVDKFCGQPIDVGKLRF